MAEAEPTSSPARALAAIMFSDVVGYTAIMGRDEREAMRALDAHRGTLRSILPKFNGRLIGEIGDGTLSSFHSAIDAVNCAREVQELAENTPELKLRIGIHLGDVVFTNNTVIGDGVNVASRIHALAPPGGICISEHVYDEIRNKPGILARDLGRKQLKNVSRPIRVYALQSGGRDTRVASSFLQPATIAAAALLVAGAISVAYVYRGRVQPPQNTAARPASEATVATLAVLPFANLSENKQDEYFADGMTDEITGQLSKISGIRVAARTSAFSFKGRNEEAPKIASLLHVRNLLEGSVQRSADKIRIEVQLVDAENGFALWSERYDEKTADVFQVQSDVAENVAEKLRIKLLPGQKERIDRPPTASLEAYDLYLQGHYQMLQFSVDGWTKAVELFTRATEKDPNFAPAWAGLADAYQYAAGFVMPPRAVVPKVRDALTRALALDPNLGAAHAALAYGVIYAFDWNWPAAEREFKVALSLDPSNAEVHSEYAEFLDHIGRSEEALAEAEKARELDPLWFITAAGMGWVYRDLRQYDRSIEWFNKAIAMNPDAAFPYNGRGTVRLIQHRYQDAISDNEKAVARQRSPIFLGSLATAYGLTGRRAEVEQILREVQRTATTRYVDPIFFVQIYFALGDSENAFASLERAYQDRSYLMTTMKLPMWDPARADPRFQAMYKKVGLP